MSELQRLKSTIDGIARTTKQTRSGLSQFSSQFDARIKEVQSVIGGSTQRKDQEVMRALEAAKKQVAVSAAALDQAAKIAEQYSRSL